MTSSEVIATRLQVICVNPERLPFAERAFHELTCACRGTFDVCEGPKAQAPVSDGEVGKGRGIPVTHC